MAAATVYTIDADDRLIRVNAAWHDFARANAAPHLASDRVLGRVLWDSVAGAEIRLIYRELTGRVRRSGAPVTLPFRCDADDRRRFMRLTIRPLQRDDQRGFLEFRAEHDREESRPPMNVLFGQTADGRLLRMCSWCKRVDLHGWVELEEAVDAHGVLLATDFPRITHGMCPACELEVTADLMSLPAENEAQSTRPGT